MKGIWVLAALGGATLLGCAGALAVAVRPAPPPAVASVVPPPPPGVAAPTLYNIIVATPLLAEERGPILTRAAAEQDIRYALARAEAIHPRLFWNSDRNRVTFRAETLIAALPGRPTPMDVYVTLSSIIGMLGDGHVSLSRPPAGRGDLLMAHVLRGGTLLAARVRPVVGGLEVLHSDTKGLRIGDLLTAINGYSAAELFASASSLSPGEPAFQERRTETEFFERLWDLGIQARFTLDGRFAGRPGRIAVDGWSRRDGALDRRPPAEDGVRLTPLPGGLFLVGIDRLTVLRDRFQRRLASVFAQIAMADADGVIIDIRQNGGGLTALAEDVLDYITDKPHRLFSRVLVRASPECRVYLPKTSAGSGPGGAMGSMADGSMQNWEVPVHQPRAEPLRFRGPVAVLIGPGTFSAANALANAIADYRLATLIGHDTAEIPNNYGNACPVRLPNTGMTLHVPSMYTVRANGDAVSREDVRADISTPPTPDEDGAEDLDVAAARDWIGHQRLPVKGAQPTVQEVRTHT